jgi:hypothetical protein
LEFGYDQGVVTGNLAQGGFHAQYIVSRLQMS